MLLESSPQIHNSYHFINPVLSRSFEASKRDGGKAEKRLRKIRIIANGVYCVLANKVSIFSKNRRRRWAWRTSWSLFTLWSRRIIFVR